MIRRSRCLGPAPRWAIGLLLGLPLSCQAALAADADTVRDDGSGGFIDAWLATSDAAKESQPHWMTPVVTVTPRLEQEFRYDQGRQSRSGNVSLENFGGSKGLELIPTDNMELILGVPAYQRRVTPKETVTGWADETLLMKYRFVSANEEHGNYIVTGFLGVSIPSGDPAFTNGHTITTPTLAVGKGWGTREVGFDVQSTVGIAIPSAGTRKLGMPVTWNTALQGHLPGKLWPELEVNYTYFKQGPNDGKEQVALTAGLVLGRFELGRRARLIIGGGYQHAVSSFHTFQYNWLLTGRVAF